MDRLKVSTRESELVLVPGMGGGIASLVLGRQAILRAADEADLASGDPLRLAEFPMAPWVNRVDAGRFSWAGETIDVTAPPVDHALGLHGFAWRMPWRVEAWDGATAALALDWPGGAVWPWPMRLRRSFGLSDRALTIQLELRNGGRTAMSAALGSHPYFPAEGASLQAAVAGGWHTDEGGIPRERGLADAAERLRAGEAVAALQLDHGFEGWDGRAFIAWPTHAVEIVATDCRYLQIYTPAGAGYFCVEPQSAMPDALNRGAAAGLLTVPPGRSVQQTMRIELAR